jgi:hypothetical protein
MFNGENLGIPTGLGLRRPRRVRPVPVPLPGTDPLPIPIENEDEYSPVPSPVARPKDTPSDDEIARTMETSGTPEATFWN